ncbi:MAG: hypothetical protein IPG79_14370 [Saprospiraceae bacterium]|nr:hypothetical protein [Saprospiraceae bacterium]
MKLVDTSLNDPIYLDMIKDNHNNINLVIFDADKIDNEGIKHGCGSYENSFKKLNDFRKLHNINFEIYLWPNNKDNGCIEDLLRKLIKKDRFDIVNCIEAHQTCLRSLNIEGIRIANEKDIIRFYLYTNKVSSTNGKDVDYTNEILWELDLENIEELKCLKYFFLDNFFL